MMNYMYNEMFYAASPTTTLNDKAALYSKIQNLARAWLAKFTRIFLSYTHCAMPRVLNRTICDLLKNDMAIHYAAAVV